jgi:hypothetical protein
MCGSLLLAVGSRLCKRRCLDKICQISASRKWASCGKLCKLDIGVPNKYQKNIMIGGIWNDAIVHTVRSPQHENQNALYVFMSTLTDISMRTGNS